MALDNLNKQAQRIAYRDELVKRIMKVHPTKRLEIVARIKLINQLIAENQ
jgi:hypothetical protein